MRQPGLAFDAPHKESYTQKVLRVFEQNKNVWIDADILASPRVGGRYAWRSRVADARKILGRIDNRQRKAREGYTISEYRYVPK